MKWFPATICFLAGILLFACSGDKKDAPRILLREQIFGQWRNIYLKLEMNSYHNTDSTRVFEVNEEDWEQRMGLRPIRTYYWADGTFNSLHYNLADSLVYNPSGRWFLQGDSLIMWDTFPDKGQEYRYKVKLYGNIAEFSGMEDCDNDGKRDDNYYGTQRKQ